MKKGYKIYKQYSDINLIKNGYNSYSTKENTQLGKLIKEAQAAVIAAAPVQAEENLADDGELVAVIAAAIAAAEGTTTDGFVVRSIRKVKRNRR